MYIGLSKILTFIISFTTILLGQDVDTLSTNSKELILNVHGILTLPNSSFGTMSDNTTSITNRNGFKIGDKIGAAKAGFGLGLELSNPVWFSGMKWIVSAKLLINPVNGSEVQSIYRSQWGDTIKVNLDFGNWINIPLMTGLKYNYQFSSNFECYGLLQGGANFSKAPSLKATDVDIIIEEAKYEFVTDFSFNAGVGIIFNKKYTFGINYLNLSTPRYKGTKELNQNYFPNIFRVKNSIIAEERRISIFSFTFGILF